MSKIVECGFRNAEIEKQRLSFKSEIRNPKSEIGFTLLEVLISLAIVSFAIIVLIHSQLLSARGGLLSNNYTTAVFLGNEILSDTFMQKELRTGIEDERFWDYPEFSWEREVKDTDFEKLKEVKIIIKGPDDTEIVLNTYCLSAKPAR